MKAVPKLDMAEAGNEMQKEFESDQGLADKFLAEANAKDLYELYQKRCKQLNDFGNTLMTMAEIYAGKGERKFMENTPNAVAAMEKVALAAIELAKAVTGKAK